MKRNLILIILIILLNIIISRPSNAADTNDNIMDKFIREQLNNLNIGS